MSGLTPEQRASEAQRLVELAKALRDLSTSTAAQGHKETILGFAAEAEKFADMIGKAVTPELAAAFAAKAAKKSAGWEELMQMLQCAQLIETAEQGEWTDEMKQAAVEEAEAKLRATATQLRAVSSTGNTAVFRAIGEMATKAEQGLGEFLAAGTVDEKLQTYARVEEERVSWLGQLEQMQTTLQDGSESQAPTEAPDPREAEVEEFHDAIECQTVDHSIQCASSGDPFDQAWEAMREMGAFSAQGLPPRFAASNWGASAGSAGAPVDIPKPAAPAAVPATSLIQEAPIAGGTPEEARARVAKYLQDGDVGFLVSLGNFVDRVKGDENFEGVHEDATKFLEQMRLAANVVLMESLELEPLRESQRAAAEAKKQAFNIQKYDLYKRTGKMPRLRDVHVDLLQCATVGVDIAEFLRKQTQEALIENVAALMAEPDSP